MSNYSLALLLLFPVSFNFKQAVEFPGPSHCQYSPPNQERYKPVAANIIFKSADGGQTWQDMSEGLPGIFEGDDISRDGFYANDTGIYLRAGNAIFHNKPNSLAPFWEREFFPNKQGGIAPGNNGIVAYNYAGQLIQKTNGTSVWAPMYTNVRQTEVRTVFETATGTLLIGSDNGLLRSINNGETWNQVQGRGWVMKLAESNGVLLATSQRGIIKSTDDGENWETVISEGGVGIAVERIDGGFAAISCNTTTESRRIHISIDNGKTWKAIDGELKPSLNISSIKQLGEYLIVGHPDGIFRSSDMGKTWKLILPSIENKVFNISVSGNVIYAIPRSEGC